MEVKIQNSKFKNSIQKLKFLKTFKFFLVLLTFNFLLLTLPTPAYAITDPLSVVNNKFGIHLIQAAVEESSPAADLVNSSGGDWGYITVLVESKDRNHGKWQEFFNDLRKRHIIPIVRLATQPDGNFWKRPYEGEEQAWADFLDALNWPTKNRYVTIYNEPNHATEWGNLVDAKSYAEILDKTITALKNKNRDFFVLNGGFDASAPSKPPFHEDQLVFMKQMNEAVSGIFEKLDGWVSHSYPNPEFAGSPDAVGRGTIRTWFWEIQQLKNLGVSKNLPIFITETGWKHAEGLNYNSYFPDTDTVSKYYQQAFNSAWNNNRIVAITPFLLNYQEAPFDHFSFKKSNKDKQSKDSSDYYSIYPAIQNLSKTKGKPVQQTEAELVKGEIYSSIVSGEVYNIALTFKNTGQSIWNDRDPVRLMPLTGGKELGIEAVELPKDKKIEPGQQYSFELNMKAPESGVYTITLNLKEGDKQFSSSPIQFTTEVKSPVVLKVMGVLGWKKDFSGDYILKIKGATGESAQNIILNKKGISKEIEARYLLPDYSFKFSLEKPYYVTQTINQQVYAGVNTLNFGTLQPDLLPAILNPAQFWQLLPFSNK
ncbi:hypothetical protein HYU93_03655 [Candidatus Daviesbacteria bacterium]|nr:hypothetical protein [Candidatus Daviesbacteria bacterium]